MKKCSNCSKDLPEAALHCVFCGAKQAAAPAVQPGLAKTAFGYSANEVMQQLGNQPPGGGYQRPQGGSQPPPAAAPYQPPGGGYQPPQGGLAQPQHNANAATIMVGPGGPPPAAGGYQPPNAAPYGGGQPYGQPQGYGGPPAGGGYQPPQGGYGAPMGGQGMGVHSPQVMTPQPLPAAAPPYLASRTASRAGRPIEPWKDALPLQMFIWGGVALAAFATPLMFDPKIRFNWDNIADAPGKAKIPYLIWGAVGLLSIVFGAIPLQTIGRGLVAMLMGLAGIVVPLVLAGHFGDRWQEVLTLIGAMCLIPGLFVRNEYTESIVGRMLVTIGVLLSLVRYLVPEHGEIPLVGLFKALINAGSHMEMVIVPLAYLVLLVMCLLVWMPGPATAGAKIFAWLLIVFPIVAVVMFTLEDLDKMLPKAPGQFLAMWVPEVVYSVLLGYGGATVIGKQLE